MKSDLTKFSRILGYQFKDISLLETALTHRSAGSNNNERLEFLGDAILNFIIAEDLFQRFPEVNEGVLSRLRASLVKGETLASLGQTIDIGEYLRLGPGELKSGGFRRESILAGALEAIIGAVYLDNGYDACRDLVQKIFQEKLNSVNLEKPSKDPKTRLQEYLQANKQPLPSYLITATKGNDHEQWFCVECKVDGIDSPVAGEGNSRRKAEQDAASRVLALLEERDNP